jgi:hypothetical protein
VDSFSCFVPSSFISVPQSLRETYNSAKYEEVLERINGRLGPEYDIDRSAAAVTCYVTSSTAAAATAIV